MTLAIVATLANFFFPGLGWLILRERIPQAIGWLVGILGLTYVETAVKVAAPDLYLPMFASVFILNTAFAVDVWRVARARVSKAAQASPGVSGARG